VNPMRLRQCSHDCLDAIRLTLDRLDSAKLLVRQSLRSQNIPGTTGVPPKTLRGPM
jgi:hypothetical protein